jgi:2-methylisocitrate lyase-like PEP mutase family enzyme
MTSGFRKKVLAQRTVWAVGAYDALSARLIEQAGFEAVFTTGFGIAASVLGLPDIGLYTMTENLGVVRNVVSAVGIPVIADADTGYGNSLNVQRTVREFEAAGVQAITLEDQVTPKRCPLLTEVAELLPTQEAAEKIRAAVATRRNPDLVVIARTDADNPEEAIERAVAYVAAGADLVQPIGKAFADLDSLKRLRRECGVPLSVMIAGWYRSMSRAEIASVAGLATYPLVPVLTAAEALRENLAALAREGRIDRLPRGQMNAQELAKLLAPAEQYGDPKKT